MADFKKYNGYNVKDASALAHASVSGSTLTTTDRDGRTVDTLTLPGGGFPSATYMSYLDDKFIKSYQNTISGTVFDSSNTVTDGSNHGLVLSSDVVGYADITFSTFYTLSDLHIQTVRSWQTFSKDGNDLYNDIQAYSNDYLRQIRPNKYRALISVGKYNNSVTVNSGSNVKVAQFNPRLTVKDPSGKTIGSAIVIGVRPHLEYNNVNTGVEFYLSANQVTAYNSTSASKTVKSVVVEVEIDLFALEIENFSTAPNTGTPFIESANGYRYVEDSATFNSYAETKVVVKNRGNVSGYYLDEYKLTYTSGTDTWSWERTASKAIPDNLTSGTYYNKSYTFKHYTMNSSTYEQQSATSAVAYMVGLGQGSSAAVSRSDAIPIASLLYWM